MINIHLSKNDAGDFDLVFENGKIKMAEDGTAAAVAMTERILLFRDQASESQLIQGLQSGTDWYGVIFRSDATGAEKEAELKRVILSTPGVDRILQWSWEQTGRTLYLDFQVKTSWGAVSVSDTIEPL